MRLLVAVTVAVGIVLAPSTASAKGLGPPIEGRHSALRAGMYATRLNAGRSGIQILDRLCPKPGHPQGCERVIVSLREAIEEVVHVPIVWVDRERRRRGTFWQLAPIQRVHAHASFDFRWDDPRPYGCDGGGTYEFERRDWVWYATGGNEFVGCP